MALVPFEFNNFVQEGEPLITTQFQDKDIFNRYLRLLKTECQELLSVFRDLIQDRDIDSAQGAQLDIIGNIVGQERILGNAALYPFFGFIGELAARSFGTVYNSTIGGYWRSYGQPIGSDILLNDDQYRQMIKAKIIKNNARGTNEDFIKFGNFVLNAKIDFEIDSAGKCKILAGRRLTLFEQTLMVYVFEGKDYNFTYSPKPLGVGLEIGEYDGSGTLGFVGTPNARGMISLAFPFEGGIFADIYF